MSIALEAASEQRAAQSRDIYVAGNISNSNIFDPADESSKSAVRMMYREMIKWAKEEGADLIVGETMYYFEEAKIALEEIQLAGLPSIINVAIFANGVLRDGVSAQDACRQLAAAGADVVGTNCFHGPQTIRPIVEAIVEATKGHNVCAMPATYRTTAKHPTLFNLPDPLNTAALRHERTFPDALEAQNSNRYETAEFGKFALGLGVKVIGLCCGASVIHHRELAEGLGRKTYLSKYSPDMSKHFLFGDEGVIPASSTQFGSQA